MNRFIDKYLKYIIVVLAICFMAIGIFKGDMEVVFTKAVAVCMECIGIG